MKRTISFLIILCLLFSLPIGAFAEKTPFYEDSEAIGRAAESVLLLTCYDNEGNPVATGSGFLAFEDGIIITNYHVIEGITGPIKANTEDGMYFDINEILCFDQTADVAILKTKAKTRLDLLTLAASSSLGKGSRVVAIGSPLGLLNIVSEGIYSGIVFDETEYILFTAAISSGSSGGALFNENGEVIGVTAATYTEGQNLNLAVPIENVKKLWSQYQSGEYVEVAPAEKQADVSKDGGEEAFSSAEQCFEQGKYSDAVEWYIQAAEQGHAEAQYKLGCCYYFGLGIDMNIAKAEEWIKKAANQGFAEAECLVGFLCAVKGFSWTYLKAPLWFLHVYEKVNGNIFQDMFTVSIWYHDFDDEHGSYTAGESFLSAANKGDAIAMYNLGKCYQIGISVEQDFYLASECFVESVDAGCSDALISAGCCYAVACGTGDFDRARGWLTDLAEKNGIDAKEYIGKCLYTIGIQYEKYDNNYVKAIEWYFLGHQMGNSDATRHYMKLNGW